MASNTLPRTDSGEEPRPRLTTDEFSLRGSVYRLLRAVSSLELTVVLMILAMGLVFIGTLAQAREGMWDVMDLYFRSIIAWVKVEVLFPPAWFPDLSLPKFSFPYPGGFLIGATMAVNLVSAHLVRFKTQAKGERLALGVVVMVIGAAVTALVVASGHNGQGLQAQPPFSWDQMWTGVQSTLALLFVGLGGIAVLQGRLPVTVRVALGLAATIFGGLAAATILGGTSARLANEALRVLWQLMQGGLGALIVLAGSWLVFKRRGGIVTLHLGVAILMFGELFVTLYNKEEFIKIWEHESKDYGESQRELELAIVDPADRDRDLVTVVPGSMLVEGKSIDDPRLPCQLEIVQYFKNSRLDDAKAHPRDTNPATAGTGKNEIAIRVDEAGGAESKSNIASAYVKFVDRTSTADLGTFLLTQWFVDRRENPIPERLRVGGKTYEVTLRPKRTYRQYAVELVKTESSNYIGTNTPREYTSDIVIHDYERGTDEKAHIKMNDPLRYAGETFYQADHRADKYGHLVSTLQVVTNRGWMITYVACMYVLIGMLAQFGGTLYRFLAGSQDVRIGLDNPSAIAAAALLVLGTVGWACLAPLVPKKDWDYRTFGRMPAMYSGRVMPLESVARNTLRTLSSREVYYDEEGKEQPAIRWLAEILAGVENADRYRVFKIDLPELLRLMDLPARPEGPTRWRYSYQELLPHAADLERLAKESQDLEESDPKKLTTLHKKAAPLYSGFSLVHQIRTVYSLPASPRSDALGDAEFLLDTTSNFERLKTTHLPMLAVSSDSDRPLEPHTFAAARQLAAELAVKYKSSEPAEVARLLLAEAPQGASFSRWIHQTELVLIQETMADRMGGHPLAPDDLEQMYGKMPANIKQTLVALATSQTRERLEQIVTPLTKALRVLKTDGSGNAQNDAVLAALRALKDGAREDFDTSVAEALSAWHESPPEKVSPFKVDVESWFDNAQLFYNLSVLYVIAFVSAALSWLARQRASQALASFWDPSQAVDRGWLVPATFWSLVLIVATHGLAIACRIYLSGRPPVTNLEGSAIFIGFAAAVLGVSLEFFYRYGIGSAVSAASGFAGLLIYMFLSMGGGDDLGVMRAVLDTQFWLATHVVCITLGYSTTFLAGMLGLVFVIGGAATSALNTEVRKSLYHMTYGILCFAIFFSLVGTVLGGLWADDSWGRFWGWDPKENGALMIVLWNAAVLHARWGGIVRERGLAVLVILGNIVTAWSWFGVNQLGFGLHSYGSTEGTLRNLGLFVLSQLVIAAIGCLPREWWLSYQASEKKEPLKAKLTSPSPGGNL